MESIYSVSLFYFYLQVLHETALIEAFNLKAGIEYQLKNCKLSPVLSHMRFIDVRVVG